MKLRNPDATFFVFSDDIEKVKSDYQFEENFIYVQGFNDYESLRIMYHCNHFIISNSSFSWWGGVSFRVAN
uniref:alpha-1,2-fucosyltransferase n=1 Tax=Exiguobacterium chiriqhucha TaxID=1385984 RepID=UPI0009EBF318|nr:alpha-1,2-fucosyltransferase [Exiguobacterium chiriqhucha]